MVNSPCLCEWIMLCSYQMTIYWYQMLCFSVVYIRVNVYSFDPIHFTTCIRIYLPFEYHNQNGANQFPSFTKKGHIYIQKYTNTILPVLLIKKWNNFWRMANKNIKNAVRKTVKCYNIFADERWKRVSSCVHGRQKDTEKNSLSYRLCVTLQNHGLALQWQKSCGSYW